MGYYMYQKDSKIHLAAENKEYALKNLKNAFPENDELQSLSILEDAMSEFGYEPYLDSVSNITDVEFINEKLRDDEKFWKALAPYIRTGSYIEMIGEDNDMWRWAFEDGKMKEIKPKIIWEG